jgi:hypothetical protein
MPTSMPYRPAALLALPLVALLAGGARAELEAPAANPPAPLSSLRVVSGPLSSFEQQRTTVEMDLSDAASTLEGLLQSDDVKAAEKMYDLERRAISLLVYAATHKLQSEGMSHDQTIGGVRSMLQRILRYQERIKDHAQDKLDQVLPGEPGRKLVQVNGKDAFKPLFRSGTPQPGQPAQTEQDALKTMEDDFTQKGGDLKRDIKLLGSRYLKSLKSGELAEWTQVGPDSISITSKGAKHPVILSEGKKRLGRGKDASKLAGNGGGSAKVWRDDDGKIVLVVVSNSSGNLKPGVSSVEPLVNKFIDLGVPEENILTTSIVPEEPELVKLLLKARLTMTKEQISAHVATLKKATTPLLMTELANRPVVAKAPRISLRKYKQYDLALKPRR